MANQSEFSPSELVLAGFEDLNLEGSEVAQVLAGGTSRDRQNLLSRLNQFPRETKEGLKNGTLQLVDKTIFSMRDCAAGTVQAFKTDDDLVDNVRNIAKQTLEKDQPMLVTEVGFAFSPDNIATGFAPAVFTPEIKRSQFGLEYGEFKILKDELIGTFTGHNVNGTNLQKEYGMKKLDNPKVMHGGDKKIVLDIKTTQATGAIMAILKGITVRPYSKSAIN